MSNLMILGNAPLTMSSREIADLVEARHNDVVATIERLFAKGLLRSSRKTRREETGGRPIEVYDLIERDTHLVVSGYSDEHRARVIDRWQELEAKQAPAFAIPKSMSEALRLAADLSEQNERLAIERDTAVRTKADSYDRAAIAKALKDGPSRTREGTEAVYIPNDDEYEMWIFHGHCTREKLEALGVDVEDLEDERLPAMAVVINDQIVKLTLSPQEGGEFPYDVLAWQRRPGMPWGMGISRQIRTVQRMLNGAVRAMMDNSGLSASPQVVIGNGVTPVDGDWTMRPGKTWRAEATSDVADVTKAFATFAVSSVQHELMNIINFALKMAEDTTGMPAMLQGIRGDAPNTLGGMQMQNNNATSVLRRLAKRFDDYMTRPHIQRYFDWMMAYSDDESIKGDFQVDVRASSALVERDAQQQFLTTLLTVSANPAYGLDPELLAEELVKGQRLDVKNFKLSQEKRQQSLPPQDPTLQAKALLLEAQAVKAQADAERAQALTVGARVEAQYSAVQTAQVIEQIPGTATTADALLRSAGSKDMDAAPIVPQASGAAEVSAGEVPTNTNPLTPANPASPAVGVQAGIETQADDGVRS